MSRPGARTVLLAESGSLDDDWPYLRPRLADRLSAAGITMTHHRTNPDHAALGDYPEPGDVGALVVFGVEPGPDDFAAMPGLRVVAGETDRCGLRHIDTLWDRGIPFVDATAGWSQSVAEVAVALTLAALRGIIGWHQRTASGRDRWEYQNWQFCDNPSYVNGTLAGKRVAIIGLGAIGGRVASLARGFGAQVGAVDPFAPEDRFTGLQARRLSLEDVPEFAQIVVVAVPPTPTATGMIGASVINALAIGSIVVTVTRASPVDVEALRARVYRDELLWATDVYDQEPLPGNDPILGRPNVIHLPHIAGRTRDANLAVADIIADAVIAVQGGTAPAREHVLTPELVHRRIGAPTLRHLRS
jgi:phosphoglycerate dehydrogenase-like enzyme